LQLVEPKVLELEVPTSFDADAFVAVADVVAAARVVRGSLDRSDPFERAEVERREYRKRRSGVEKGRLDETQSFRVVFQELDFPYRRDLHHIAPFEREELRVEPE
jgi:hypothetical protein